MSSLSRSLLLLLACLGFVSCRTPHSYFKYIADLPIKETRLPAMSWQSAPLRANAQYVFFGAQSSRQLKNRLGDYYFVKWYDATPEQPTTLQMLYTQALTTSQVLTKEIHFNTPRSSRGSRKTLISFNGPDRAKRGDILSWRLNLIVNGQIVDTRRSYLWVDPKR